MSLLDEEALAAEGWGLVSLVVRGEDATAVYTLEHRASGGRATVTIAPPDRCPAPAPLSDTTACVGIVVDGAGADGGAADVEGALGRFVAARAAAPPRTFVWGGADPTEAPRTVAPPPAAPPEAVAAPAPAVLDATADPAAKTPGEQSDGRAGTPFAAPGDPGDDAGALVRLLRTVLPFPALFLIVFGPGFLIMRRRFPAGTSAAERWALYAGVGLAAVALASGVAYLVPWRALGVPVRLVPPLAAGVVALVAWWLGRRRAERGEPGRGEPALALARVTAADIAVAVAAALAFVLFFLGIDDASRFDSCVFKGVAWLYAPEPGAWQAEPPPTSLFAIPAHSRVGNALAFAVAHALHGPVGRRLTSGLVAALVVLAMTALGRRVTGRTWPALAAALLLLVTDDVFGSQVVNQNLFAAALAALFLVVLHPVWRDRWALRGLLAAAMLTSRYVTVVTLGALLFVTIRDALRGGGPRAAVRDVLRQLGAVVALTAPAWIVIAWERATTDLVISSFFLNAPFHEQLVRPPFVPLPLWLGWPVHWIGQWGVLGAAAVIVGLGYLWRRGRAEGGRFVWLLYGVPLYVALGAQANWFEPEKMTIGLLLAPVWVAALAATLHEVTRSRRLADALRPVGFVALVVAALAYLRPLLFLGSTPEDPRLRQRAMPNLRHEGPLGAFEEERWRAWPLLPRPRARGVLAALDRKAADAWRRLGYPTDGPRPDWSARWTMQAILAEFEPEATVAAIEAGARPVGPAVEGHVLALDLRESVTISDAPLRPLAAPPAAPSDERLALHVTTPYACALTPRQFRVATWSEPCRVAVCLSGTDEAWVFVAPPAAPIGPGHPDFGVVAPIFRRNVSEMELAALPLEEEVVLVLPERVDRVNLAEIVYLNPDRIYLRRVVRGDDGAWRHGPPHFWRHN